MTFPLTSAANGVKFDLDSDGVPERTAWTGPESKWAFLAIDRNKNGRIDNGSELFGDNTVPRSNNAVSLLQTLNLELNGGRRTAGVNVNEPLFAQLLLWEDRNHNGISEAEELQPVSNVFSEIGLGYLAHDRRDGHGNFLKYRGWAAKRIDRGANPAQVTPHKISSYDVFFMQR